MKKNCKTCKFEHLIGLDEPCNTCNYTDNIRRGYLYSKWQPKPITYTRDEVLELMKMSSDAKHWELELSNKEILDNFDKIKSQTK